jgi:hypothetical protein
MIASTHFVVGRAFLVLQAQAFSWLQTWLRARLIFELEVSDRGARRKVTRLSNQLLH